MKTKFTRLATLLLLLTVLLSLGSVNAFASVTQSDGNHEEWVDRIELDGVQYAIDFKNWLDENSDMEAIANGGSSALLDPTLGECIDGSKYVYEVASFTGEGTFSHVDGDDSGNEARAEAAVSSQVNENFNTVGGYVTAIYNAFDRDRPEIFWLGGSLHVLTSYYLSYGADGRASFEQSVYFLLKSSDFDIRAADYQNPDTVRSLICEVFVNPDGECAVDKILSGVDENADRVTKVRYFNDWLTKNNCYNNSENLEQIDHDCREATSALLGKAGDDPEAPVCEAYARAFKVLCDRAGIPCTLVNGNAGTGSEKEAHMWNYVQMENGNWYAVDVTWNDMKFKNGFTYTNDVVSGVESEDYLLIGSNTLVGDSIFSSSHLVTNVAVTDGFEFTNQPTLSDTEYTLFEVQIPSALRIGGVTAVTDSSPTDNALPSDVSYNPATNTITLSDGASVAGTDASPYAIECSGNVNLVINGHALLCGYGANDAIRITGGTLTVVNDGNYLYRSGSTAELTDEESVISGTNYVEIIKENHLTAESKRDGTHSIACRDGECTLLFSDLSHACYGGEATCQSVAICEMCKVGYGELGTHSFTQKTESEKYLKKEVDCQHQNEYWYACATCGDVSDTDYYIGQTVGAHTFTERIEDAAHYVNNSGDCHSKKQYYLDCALCDAVSSEVFEGTEYGDHKIDKKNWTSNGTQHFHKCTVEGCTHTVDNAECSGGKANCTAKALCEVCKQEYGSLSDHVYGAPCDSDCNVCLAVRDAADHYDGNENYVCDFCSAIYAEKAIGDIFGIDAKIVGIIAAGVLLLIIILKIVIGNQKEKRKARKYREKMARKLAKKQAKAEKNKH